MEYDSTAFLQVRKSHICTKEAQWKTKSPCRSPENQSLIVDDYTNNSHPVSTLSGAAQHLAEKSILCKLDCFQAYHCLQKAN